MTLHLHLHYKVAARQQLSVTIFNHPKQAKDYVMHSADGENWYLELTVSKEQEIQYKYQILLQNGGTVREWGNPRIVNILSDAHVQYDKWQARAQIDNIFLTNAFTKAFFSKNNTSKHKKNKKSGNFHFSVLCSAVPKGLAVGITGNTPFLGNWGKPVPLTNDSFPEWVVSIETDITAQYFEYKYVIFNPENNLVTSWEAGENRVFNRKIYSIPSANTHVQDLYFRHQNPWRGAGVAIPVFSLRSKNGMGIGEFNDLKILAEWCKKTGIKIIQVLPVNDTIATKTWTDSYPYAAVSVYALHPLYIHLPDLIISDNKILLQKITAATEDLNKNQSVDFDGVLENKMNLLKEIYLTQSNQLINDKSYKAFLSENKDWLYPYAAYCVLRDKNTSCVFRNWPEHSTFSEKEILKFCKENTEETGFYCFIQYHAHKQLTEARNYSRSLGIALKGDLPIGIYRHSCDAWVAPELYNMSEQAGAPPDDYAENGQNWGFPTYNWEVMAKDNFSWWSSRMKKLGAYFDALRIDHILGFFRIWAIPTEYSSGTMGLFNPRIPMHIDEMRQFGLHESIERLTKPFITGDLLRHIFGDNKEIITEFFDFHGDGMLQFKAAFYNQESIISHLHKNPVFLKYEAQLLKLQTEVLFIREPDQPDTHFNPRITVQKTFSFQCLSHAQQDAVNRIYNHYYYERHNVFWKDQALWKLPAILDASNMLICGEDLGMIPETVPDVMQQMNIMSLEIQRMPKGSGRFGQVGSYPYFSVCSPSCHDMSTIRGWWESDHEMAKDFYYQYMHESGLTPMECNAKIVQYIIEDHLASPSIMAIFPIQDLLALDENLRYSNPKDEQINDPANPKHYWKYRLHVDLEILLQQKEFNDYLRHLISYYRP